MMGLNMVGLFKSIVLEERMQLTPYHSAVDYTYTVGEAKPCAAQCQGTE